MGEEVEDALNVELVRYRAYISSLTNSERIDVSTRAYTGVGSTGDIVNLLLDSVLNASSHRVLLGVCHDVRFSQRLVGWARRSG